ncbi:MULTISPECIES: hypothetical protein [Burkholderia]|nr:MULTISPECIES: hypothetical protein [Burkholderia]
MATPEKSDVPSILQPRGIVPSSDRHIRVARPRVLAMPERCPATF